MLSVFIQAVKKTPKLREVDTMSLLGRFRERGQRRAGNPTRRCNHAHIIPFEKNKWNPTTRQREKLGVEVNIIFGYQGLLELVYRSGLLRSVHADVVWRDEDNPDHFRFHYGSGSELFHKPKGGQRGEGEMPVWGYTHANMKGDAEMFEVMPMADILRIRDATQAYSSAVAQLDKANEKGWKSPAGYTESPWVKHFVPMAKKTVFRAAAKWLPKSIELASAISLDEAQERGRIPYENVIEGTASMLDGGLDAVTDEYADRDTVDIGGAFSTQESRQPADARGEQDTAPAKTKTAPAPTDAAKQTQTTAPAANGFGAYLIDEWGEVAGDEFTNALDFAQALRRLAGVAENVHALMEHNADGIALASAANSAARKMIEGITAREEPTTATAAAQPSGPIAVPKDRQGKEAWPLYVKAVKEALPSVTAPFLNVWAETNLPTILRAPSAQRLLIVKAVTDRAKAAGCPVPAGIAGAIGDAEPAAKPAATENVATGGGAVDQDLRWAQQTVAQIEGCKTVDEVRQLAGASAIMTRMNRLRQEREDLFKMVDDAAAKAINGFGPPKDEAEEAGGPPEADPNDPGYA